MQGEFHQRQSRFKTNWVFSQCILKGENLKLAFIGVADGMSVPSIWNYSFSSFILVAAERNQLTMLWRSIELAVLLVDESITMIDL